ncbi:LmeA family phospholipid-binding protein [Salinifilum ghardaiensis]
MKKLAISLVVLLAVLVAADFGAAAFAERKVSQQLRGQLELQHNPEVRIHGFPFLAQVVAGDYRNVEVSAEGVRAEPLQQLGISANLHHARVDTRKLVNGNAEQLTVDDVDGRVRLLAGDVGRLIDVPDLAINPVSDDKLAEASGENGDRGESAQGGSDQDVTGVRLDGTIDIAGQKTQVHVIAALSLENGKIRVEPRDLGLKNDVVPDLQLPGVFKNLLRQQFTTTIDPGRQMPFDVTPTGLRVEHGALVMEGKARDVTVDMQGSAAG